MNNYGAKYRHTRLSVQLILRMMKLITFFLIIGMIQVSASTFGQQIFLKKKQASIKSVLHEIANQSKYQLVYTDGVLRKAGKIDVDLDGVSLEVALNQVFQDQPITYKVDRNTIMVRDLDKNTSPVLVPVRVEVRGKIVDSTGLALNGASIRVLDPTGKRTTLATTTDRNGEFVVHNVPEDFQLEITYVGFVSRRIPGRADVGVIVLSALPATLEEVAIMVNTGYQTLPKERATGSFVFVDNQKFESRNDYRIMDRLVENVPGLQFDNRGQTSTRNRSSYNIRGMNTFIQGLNGPLIVVDDFPYEGDIDLLNPADVESVTLLKDAAASSVWGARAANGVVVINMKKAQGTHPIQINFGSSVTFTEKENLWYRKMISTSDFMDQEIEFFNRNYYNNDLTGLNSRVRVTSPLVDLLNEHRLGHVSQEELETQIARWRTLDYRKEYNQLFVNNPIRQSYNLGFNGNSQWIRYLVSGSYERSTQNLKSNYDNRYTLRTTTEIKPTDKLSIEVGMMYVQNIIESGAGYLNYPIRPGGGKQMLYPYAEFRGPDGEALQIPYQYNKRFVDTAGHGKLLDWTMRPLLDRGQQLVNRNFTNLHWNAKIQYQFTKNITFEARYGMQRQATHSDKIATENSFEMRNLINRWTQIKGEEIKYILPRGARIQRDDDRIDNHQFRSQLNYDRSWNSRHQIHAFIASDISELKGNAATYSAYGYDLENKTHVMVDYLTPHPVFGRLSGNARIPSYLGFESSMKRMVSFLGNASYAYANKYTFSVSGRRDASNLLGVHINEKWKPLWSTGFAWSLHQEEFLNAQWINVLKLRATYGHSGNIAAGNGYYPIINMSNGADYSGLPYALISTPPDPNRKWEDTRMMNLGLDFALWGNRLSGSIEYFNKKNTDLIAADRLDPSSGMTSMNRNVGVMVGNGWDVILNSNNLKTGGFEWTTNFSMSYVHAVVKKIYGNSISSQLLTAQGGRSLYPIEGYSMFPVFSFRSAGLDPENGDPRGIDRRTGEISKDYLSLLSDSLQHLVYHGVGIPPYHGFLRNNFGYKNFDLSMNLVFKFGSFFREEMYMDEAYSRWEQYGNYEDRWQKPGDEEHTYIPSTTYPRNSNRLVFAQSNEDFVHKSDLIRFSDLRIGYRQRMRTRGNNPVFMNFYLGVRNMGLIWTANTIHVDPDNIYFAEPRSYNTGLSITF